MKKIINKYLDTKKKKIIAVSTVACIIVVGSCVVYALTRNNSPKFELNKKIYIIEYGESFNADFNTLVKTKDLDYENKSYLAKNVKIKSDIENDVETINNEDGTTSERDRGFAKVGDYKVTIKYKKETKEVKVKVKDTTKPEIEGVESIDIILGTDIKSYDFTSLFTITDLASVETTFDTSSIDVNSVGTYIIKINAKDANGNKETKDVTVNIIQAPKIDEEIVQEIVTNEDGTTSVKTTTKKKTMTTTNGSNSNSNSNSSSNTGNSSSNGSNDLSNNNSGSSSSNTNGGSSGENNSNGSSNGSSSVETPPLPEKIKYFWAKCGCGYYIESTVSINDVKNKLFSVGHGNGNNGLSDNGDCYHYNYGSYEK